MPELEQDKMETCKVVELRPIGPNEITVPMTRAEAEAWIKYEREAHGFNRYRHQLAVRTMTELNYDLM